MIVFLASAVMTILDSSRRFLTGRVAVALVMALSGSAVGTVPAGASDAAGQTGQTGPAVTAAGQLARFESDGTGDGHGQAASFIDSLPSEIVAALGYTPVVVDGVPADPQGDCSSPIALPSSFTPACLTHDLGYDLLRVARASGERIPRTVRPALDRQLAQRMAASCTAGPLGGSACRLVAEVADAAVRVNSRRQHEGPPLPERWPWS